jgi:hypothetical protein
MEIRPVHTLITRDDDGDPQHDTLHDVPGMITGEPVVGVPLQVFLDSGKVMRTSAIKRIDHRGSELIVETANSRYRLKTSNAA